MSEPSQLERAWAVLSPPRGADVVSFPLDVSFDGSPCRVALDAGGARHLLVPVGRETVTADPRPAVLGLTVRRLGFDAVSEAFVDVSCAEAELFPEFDDVVADVLESVRVSDRPAAATIQTVGRWRRLFKSRLMRGLSRQAKLGLFAELCTLAALVDADPDFPVSAWRGPLREPHDFEAPSRCLEIKALGATSDSITVHGIEQLASHGDRDLDLLLLRVVDDPEGRTVDEVIKDVRRKARSTADLQMRLAAAGWAASPGEDTETFAIEEILRIRINESVPRLVAASLATASLPDGLHDLRYELDLTALLPHADTAELTAVAGEAVR